MQRCRVTYYGTRTFDRGRTGRTVLQPAPTGHRGHAPREVVVVVRHAYGHDVLVVADGRLELQQRDVVLERGLVVLPVHDHALHVLADAPLGLHLAADVVFAEHGHQVGQESAENRRRRYIIIIIIIVDSGLGF